LEDQHQVGVAAVAAPQLILGLKHFLTLEDQDQVVPQLMVSFRDQAVVGEILDQVAQEELNPMLLEDLMLNQALDVDLRHNVHPVFSPPENFLALNVHFLMAQKDLVVQQGHLLGLLEDLSKMLILGLFQPGQMAVPESMLTSPSEVVKMLCPI